MRWPLFVIAACLLCAAPARAAEPVQLQGVFRVVHADARLGDAIFYALEADDGKVFRLRGAGSWHRLHSGTRVAIRGTRHGSEVTLPSAGAGAAQPGAAARTTAP